MHLHRQNSATVATGFASATQATPELAALAARQALSRINTELAISVLLFLTPQFARNTQAAISAVAKTCRCLQVVGCTAAGVFTETDTSGEDPAAAVLVLCGETGLIAADHPLDQPRLTLLSASALRKHSFPKDAPGFGIVATDHGNRPSGHVWLRSKLVEDGHCATHFSHARVAVEVSRGLLPLSPALTVTDADGHELLSLDRESALLSLIKAIPAHLQTLDGLPASHLFAALAEDGLEPEAAMASNRYWLLPIVGINRDEESITLSLPLQPGQRIFWVLRQPDAAEHDTARALDKLGEQVVTPDFALLFACLGRGPFFYGGQDRDLALIGERFPGLPVLGAYGAGELAPLAGGNQILSYSAILALISSVQS